MTEDLPSDAELRAMVETLGSSGPHIQKLFRDLKLSPAEISLLETMIAEMGDHGESSTYRALTSVDWKEEPISAKRFIEDPYYMGLLNESLYPGVKADFISIMDRPVPVLELILTGSLRWGKSYITALTISYLTYKLGCMVNPQRYLGLSPVSSIYILNVSVTGDQASGGIFSDLTRMVQSSPWFSERFRWNDKVSSELQFPNNIFAKSGNSSEFSAIGKNVFIGAIDEANFFGVKRGSAKAINSDGEYDAAKTLYEALVKRIRLTYTSHGVTSGLGIISSSARYPQDFIERKKLFLEEERKQGRDDGTTVVLDHSAWDVKDPAQFTKPRFRVEVGDEQRSSRILKDGKRDESGNVVEEREEGTGKIIEVPGEYRSFFAEDLEGALRDIAGISTVSISPFFSSRENVNSCFARPWYDENYVHPFNLVVSNNLEEPLIIERLVGRDLYGRPAPLRNPNALRGVAIDLAKGDAKKGNDPASIAIGHVSGWKDVVRSDVDNIRVETLPLPIITIDLILRIIAQPGSEIEVNRVLELIFKFQVLGFKIQFVVADQWNSLSTLQALRRKNIDSKVKSAREKSYTPFHTWKSAVYDGRFNCYPYTPLRDEMISLEDHAGVIDHPKWSWDDCSVTCAVLTDELVNNATLFSATGNQILINPVNKLFDDVDSLNLANLKDAPLPPPPVDPLAPEVEKMIDYLVFQNIPINWSILSPDEKYVCFYYLRFRAKWLAAHERYVPADRLLKHIQEVKGTVFAALPARIKEQKIAQS